jgi:hypothetical protein
MKFGMKRPSNPKAVGPDAARAPGDGPISSRRKKGELGVVGRWLLGLFFSVFLTVGVLATYSFSLKPWLGVWAARTWVPVTCQILSSEVKSHSGESTTYSVAISYAYTYDGREYTGSRYNFTTGASSGRKAKKEIVARHPEGTETLCYVNPDNPQEAVIERSRVRDWGFGLIPLVFVLVGAGGVWFAIMGPRKKPGAHERGQVSWRPAREEKFSRTVATSEEFSAEDTGGDRGGPVELKPVESRVGKLVGVLVFALFWNGIVSVFVVNLVGDALRGAGILWVFLLFLVPFVGIGLFLLGLAVQLAMALANPVPRLTVNRRTFSPGETVELAWRFEGAVTRLKQVRLVLEGREECTYRRGTDTRTDRDVFATLEIASASGLSAGIPGQAALRLPERLMHSFKADNNRIVWSLRVKGEIRWWPDVDEAFELMIAAPARTATAAATPPSSDS